jgi:hypothetical protein
MKVTSHVKSLISDRIDPIVLGAESFCNLACKKSREIYHDVVKKNFKLNAAQIKKIEKRLLNGRCVDINSIRTAAQNKAVEKAWGECTKRDLLSTKRRCGIRANMGNLRTAVLADLELCDCECEQRVIVAAFLKHNLTKPWKIGKCQPEVPCD